MSDVKVRGEIAEATISPRRLPGFEGFWVLIAGDLMIFALLFGSFMSARRGDVAAFETARGVLSYQHGGINTLLLLTSSWCVVMALRAARAGVTSRAQRFLGAAVLCGIGFIASKAGEYVAEATTGHAHGSFFMYYFALTGIHLVHVVIGTFVLGVFWMKWRAGGSKPTLGFESAAVFWHMVDLLWVVIFPLLYLLR